MELIVTINTEFTESDPIHMPPPSFNLSLSKDTDTFTGTITLERCHQSSTERPDIYSTWKKVEEFTDESEMVGQESGGGCWYRYSASVTEGTMIGRLTGYGTSPSRLPIPSAR